MSCDFWSGHEKRSNVIRASPAELVHVAEVLLRFRVVLLGGSAVTQRTAGASLRGDALALLLEPAQVQLAGGVAPVCAAGVGESAAGARRAGSAWARSGSGKPRATAASRPARGPRADRVLRRRTSWPGCRRRRRGPCPRRESTSAPPR